RRSPPISTLFPYTTLFRSVPCVIKEPANGGNRGNEKGSETTSGSEKFPDQNQPPSLHSQATRAIDCGNRLSFPPFPPVKDPGCIDRKSTRLNSSHLVISYA